MREILLIDENGEKVGVVPIEEARAKAEAAGLDLVEIVPTAKPPVCKIIDYGKYKFEVEKKAKEAKKHQQIVKIKEIRLQPKIDTHDYNFKLNHVKEFLGKGNKVKITIRFRGRQLAHMDLGDEVLEKFKTDLKEFGIIETDTSVEGKTMSMVVGPKGKKK